MKIGLLRFSSTVEIASGRSVSACEDSLRSLIEEPAKLERYKPFLGFVAEGGGEVRQRMPMFGFMPARILRFTLTPCANGCCLEGEFALRKAIRFPVSIYLALCMCGEAWAILGFLFRRPDSVIDLAGAIVGFLMVYGWTYAVVRVNRKPEDQMVRALKHVMADEQSAAVVADLLSSSR